MRLTATDLYTLLRPGRCELRVHLDHGREERLPPGPFEELLFKLGGQHEAVCLSSFPEVLDLRGVSELTRLDATRQAVGDRVPVIYQAALQAQATVEGVDCEIYGEPDFLVRKPDGYALQDAKLSRRINASDHPEILASLQLYAWLYEQTFGELPVSVDVLAGDGSTVPVEYEGPETALSLLGEILAAKMSAEPPYSPVGWSKCEPCGFSPHCWEPAIERRDAAVLPSVDQGLARALRKRGIETIAELGAGFNVDELAEFQRPHGRKLARVGQSTAESILRQVEAWEVGAPIPFGQLQIPEASAYVMFDLEGLPPFQDDLDRIYLWGFQAFGDQPGQYAGVATSIGPEGDRETWEGFLSTAGQLFESHGDIPWVHWSAYERTYLRKYIKRYGDVDDIAQRVDANLLDLLPVTRNALTLPVPSYGLKVIERYVGFQRSQSGVGGDWSIAQYIEAVECDDDARRQELIEEIRTYNREDLEATWAVFQWVRSQFG